MDRWKVEIKCFICGKAFPSKKSVFGHLRHHSLCERMAAAAAEVEEAGLSERKDLLRWPIATRKRSGGNKCRTLVAVEAGHPPSENPGMGLAISNFGSLEVADLPLKKRIHRGRKQKLYSCSVCGRVFANYRALGGHRAHHKIKEKKKQAVAVTDEGDTAAAARNMVAGQANRELVVYEPPPPPQRRCNECLSCGRAFSSAQGLGGHKRHCRGPAAAENKGCAVQFYFDLNELPQPEAEETPALPWYDDGAKGPASVCN